MQGHYTPSMVFGMCIRCHLIVFLFSSFFFFPILFLYLFLLLHMLFFLFSWSSSSCTRRQRHQQQKGNTHPQPPSAVYVCVIHTITDGDKRLTMDEMGLLKKIGDCCRRALEIVSLAEKRVRTERKATGRARSTFSFSCFSFSSFSHTV